MTDRDIGQRSQDLFEIAKQHSPPFYRPERVVLERGRGVWVWDSDGNIYLDLAGGYGALSYGHIHPDIYEALKRQGESITMTSARYRNEPIARLEKLLYEMTGYETMMFLNTGREAVDTAGDIAVKWGKEVKKISGDSEIIGCEKSFHGRGYLGKALSTNRTVKEGFGPYPNTIKTVPFCDAEALANAITPNTAAFIVEPIQVEDGLVTIPKDGYLRDVAEICRENNVLFVADEIATGLGRTGKLLAVDYEAIRPDIVLLGKSLGGGTYPFSAILSRRDVLSVLGPGTFGSTYGANPLGSEIAVVSLEVLVREKLIENSSVQGEYFIQQLQQIQSPLIKEVRGKGLLIGLELTVPSEKVREYVKKFQHEGLLMRNTGRVILIEPPLIITQMQINWALNKISGVLGD